MRQIPSDLEDALNKHRTRSSTQRFDFYDLEQKIIYGRQLINYVKMLENDLRNIMMIEDISSCAITIKGKAGGSVVVSSDHKPRCPDEYKELYRELMLRIIDHQIAEARAAFAALDLGNM